MKDSTRNFLFNAGFTVTVIIFAALVMLSVIFMRSLIRYDRAETHTHQVMDQLGRILTELMSAESGQRGYIITGNEKYLQPYLNAVRTIDSETVVLRHMTKDNPFQQKRIDTIERLTKTKLEILDTNIDVRRAKGLDAASWMMANDKGMAIMDSLCHTIHAARNEEARLLGERTRAKERFLRDLVVSRFIGGVFGFSILLIIFVLLKKENAGRAVTERKLRLHQERLDEIVTARTHALESSESALRESESRLKTLNENLEGLVVERTEQVRSLSKELTIAEQRERQRFSRILHDDLQQILFGAKMLLDAVDCTSPEGLEENERITREVGNLLQKALETTRSVAVELNPPVLRNEGLDASLAWLAHHMEERYGLAIATDISGDLSRVRGIDQILAIQLTRELLFNVVKHAQTREVAITAFREGNAIRISVEDHGAGFDPEKIREKSGYAERMGLFSIGERLGLFGGKLEILSHPGAGTKVTVSIPVRG